MSRAGFYGACFAVGVAFGLLAGCSTPAWREIIPPTVGEAFDVQTRANSATDGATAAADCAALDSARRSRLPQVIELEQQIAPQHTVWAIDYNSGAVFAWPHASPSPLPYVCVRLHFN